MICQTCGTENEDNVKFCEACGKNLSNENLRPAAHTITTNTEPQSAWKKYRNQRRKTQPYRIGLAIIIIGFVLFREYVQ